MGKMDVTNPEPPGRRTTSLATCDKCGRPFALDEQVWIKSEAPFAACDQCYQASPLKNSGAYGFWTMAKYKPMLTDVDDSIPKTKGNVDEQSAERAGPAPKSDSGSSGEPLPQPPESPSTA